MSIVSDKFPAEWKVARVTPIFKKGQRSMLDNYRPISILPVVSKLMERILYDQMFDYLKKQNILSEHQFGFRQLHSTTTTLLDCTNEWYVNMNRGLYNIVVLLDLKKAFDTVNHEILLSKFGRYGFGKKAVALLCNYLMMSIKWNAFRPERNNLRYSSGKYTWPSSVYYLYIKMICQIVLNKQLQECLRMIPALQLLAKH